MNKLLFLGVFLLASVSIASADLKVATVDLSKAFDQYYKTKDAQAALKQQEDSFQKDLQDMKTDYDHMYSETETLKNAATDPTLSATAQADKKTAYQAKLQDLQNMQAKIQETTQERNRELQDEIVRRHKEIVEEISKVVTDYSGPKGFDLVIDRSSSSATGVPIVLYSSPKLVDITSVVIAKLNATAPATSLAVPAPTGAGTGAH